MSEGRKALMGRYQRNDMVIAKLTGAVCRLRRPAIGKGCEGVWEAVQVTGHPACVGSIQYIVPARIADLRDMVVPETPYHAL